MLNITQLAIRTILNLPSNSVVSSKQFQVIPPKHPVVPKTNRKFIIIVGGGDVGYNLSKLLLSLGHRITVIEKDEITMQRLSREKDLIVFHGDGCNPDILRQTQMKSVDIFMALTGDDEKNAAACLLASSLGAKKSIGRMTDPNNNLIFQGVGSVVDEVRQLVKIIFNDVLPPALSELVELVKGKLTLDLLEIKKGASVIGKQVQEVFRGTLNDCTIAAIIRGDGKIVTIKGDVPFKEGDQIFIVATPQHLQPLITIFEEERC